ncbi:MAG: prolipoprotein diacylglyceryl transferase [Dissulfurispiraceae bacterium]|nr:prolipoprotein diacylglyceryl transferase [Dissulfurispiraceae bacterium]
MISYPNIDPEIFRIGPLSVRWYGLMYLAGFAASYLLVRYQLKIKHIILPKDTLESLYSYLILGLLIGARLGYAIFYNFNYYIHRPLEIFALWQGGMSFHGALIGIFVAGILFYKKYRVDFWQLSDMVIITAPIGLGLGRIGNFINGELYGRVSNVPWAMVFPGAGSMPRHPSQLYEFMLEGAVLFTVLWMLRDRYNKGIISGLFLVLYGVFRFIVEMFREPDEQVGYIMGVLTMGQLLSFLMIFVGLGVIMLRKSARQ